MEKICDMILKKKKGVGDNSIGTRRDARHIGKSRFQVETWIIETL